MKHTRTALRATQIIGHTRNGKPVFSIAGGADDGTPPGSESDDEESEDEDDPDGKGGDKSDKDSDKGSSSETVSREEFDTVMERMKAADRRAAAAEKKVQEQERAERTELENTQSDLEQTSSERDTLRTENQDLKVRLAVALSSEAQKFHDVEDALLHLKVSDLSDEDGDVDSKAVAAALKDLAERKPHLVKSEKSEDDEEEEEEKPPSGSPMNGGKKRKDGLDKASLAKKYPALRGR